MLTFDGGWLDNWLQVFPVLQEFNLHAHLFLVTSLISDGPVRIPAGELVYSHDECQKLVKQGRADEVMLRWSEVREMHLSGLVEFHSHTHTHRRWDQKPVSRNPSDLLRVDILLSRKRMRRCWVIAVSICAGLRAGIVLTIFMWLKSWGSHTCIPQKGV